jgi:hypothetical protein
MGITCAMSIADEFRAKARKCFERARRAPDIDYQQLFRDLAVQWLAMAAEADASASIDPPELPPSDEGKPDGESGGSGLTGLTRWAARDIFELALAPPEPSPYVMFRLGPVRATTLGGAFHFGDSAPPRRNVRAFY